MVFSKRLKEIRSEQGLNQRELAALSELSPQSISSFEKGINSPTVPSLLALANALNVSVDYLLGRTDDLGAAITPERSVPQLTEEEQSFLDLFRRLSRGERVQLLAFAAGLVGKERPEKKFGE